MKTRRCVQDIANELEESFRVEVNLFVDPQVTESSLDERSDTLKAVYLDRDVDCDELARDLKDDVEEAIKTKFRRNRRQRNICLGKAKRISSTSTDTSDDTSSSWKRGHWKGRHGPWRRFRRGPWGRRKDSTDDTTDESSPSTRKRRQSSPSDDGQRKKKSTATTSTPAPSPSKKGRTGPPKKGRKYRKKGVEPTPTTDPSTVSISYLSLVSVF